MNDLVFRLSVPGLLGLAALVAGLAFAGDQRAGVASACSLGCLAAVLPWLLLCLLFAATTSSEYLPGLGWLLAARAASVGACVLSALGSALGLFALAGRRGAAALALNALVLACSGIALGAQLGQL